MKKLLLFAAAALMAGTASATTWAVVGAITNWGDGTPIQLTQSGDNYTTTIKDLTNDFKIVPLNDDGGINWDYCYSTGTPIVLGEATKLTARNGGDDLPNITFADIDGKAVLNVDANIVWNPTTETLTVSGKATTGYPVLYMTGSFCGWPSPGEGNSVEGVQDQGIYTFSNVNLGLGGNVEFKIAGKNWANELGSSEAGTVIGTEPVSITPGKNNLVTNLKGVYTLIFNFDKMSMYFVEGEGEVEMPTLYVIGDNVDGENWTSETNKMTYDEKAGTYTWSGKELGAGFKFNNGDWHSGYNIGAPSEGALLIVGEPFQAINGGDAKDIIFANEVEKVINPTVTLVFDTMTVTVTGQTSGVESLNVDATEPAVYYNLQGVKVNNPQNGIFVVKQGNKTHKVVIR